MNRKERRAARKTHRSAAEAAVPASAQPDAFVKLLQAARQKEELGGPSDEVIAAYMKAAAACPTRAEALHGAARFSRNKGIHEQGYQIAVKGLAIARPTHPLAIEDWIYDYGLLDELAVSACWIGRSGLPRRLPAPASRGQNAPGYA
jgi:hypothetical protein